MTLQDQVWDRISRLACTVTCSIVTSGYSDRYVQLRARYDLTLNDDGARVQFDSQDAAIDALIFLTGRPSPDVAHAVFNAKTRYGSTWFSADGASSATGPVRHEVLHAIASLAVHEHRLVADGSSTYTEQAVEEFRATALRATRDEIECARYWLAECNRLNALTGREQVAYPALRNEP